MWISITILVAVIGITYVNGECSVCKANGVACVSETEFRICTDITKNIMDIPVYSCAPNEICTALAPVCVPKADSNAMPLCTNKCSICELGKSFTCTSRTTFALCSNGVITTSVGSCPDGTFCDVGTGPLCKEKCGTPAYQCDRAASPGTNTTTSTTSTTTSTTTTTTRPPPTGPTPAQVCAAKNTAGRFPYDNDTACLDYVFCRYQGTTLVAVASSCPTGTFFNKYSQFCDSVKPAGCL